ncbi:hypothetical protein A1O3_06573 [Capronia epimyces CBS 606.96]|uniref:Glutamate-1-semialdehyde 2,1-aminomutase n=1 Tax=Capronia epimyces CBS 606.96 TaxID=1182542 RepID=W9XR96_9EURO|nr:uncharacterized protein A1O3_06573 [Capronia epimyces CBS 606.96]EXJ82758.1 hypothetical protein A1O3_06573 [Capronia epimyces CBS 606.96]
MVEDLSATQLQQAVAEAQAQYVSRNPQSFQLHQKAQQYLPGGNTRTVIYTPPFPLTFSGGKDATLTTVDGDVYVDFLGEFSAGIYGHSNARIKKAVVEALDAGWNLGGHGVYEKLLAAKVVERFRPSGIELVRFTNSGTEANTMAVATALHVTGRTKVLVFTSAFHGSTFVFPKAPMKSTTTANLNLPHEFVLAPFNNMAETQAIVAALPAQSLAAIMVEPVQGSGGCRPATREFMHYLRQTADEQRAILIVDEVMASRLGFHGSCASLGIRADLVSLGKYIGGGMTFGAFGGRRDLMELFDPARALLAHPGTFNNNVVSMAAGVEGLDIYDADKVASLNATGVSMKKAIQAILIDEGIYPRGPDSSWDLIEVDSFHRPTMTRVSTSGEADAEATAESFKLVKLPLMFVTGRGSMLNLRFSGPQEAQWSALFYHHMLQNNIYIAQRGYSPLNLELTQVDVDAYVSAIQSFVSKHKTHLRALS